MRFVPSIVPRTVQSRELLGKDEGSFGCCRSLLTRLSTVHRGRASRHDVRLLAILTSTGGTDVPCTLVGLGTALSTTARSATVRRRRAEDSSSGTSLLSPAVGGGSLTPFPPVDVRLALRASARTACRRTSLSLKALLPRHLLALPVSVTTLKPSAMSCPSSWSLYVFLLRRCLLRSSSILTVVFLPGLWQTLASLLHVRALLLTNLERPRVDRLLPSLSSQPLQRLRRGVSDGAGARGALQRRAGRDGCKAS